MERGVGREGSGVCGTVRVRARDAQVGRFHLPICRTKSLLRKRLVYFIHRRKLLKQKVLFGFYLQIGIIFFPMENESICPNKESYQPTFLGRKKLLVVMCLNAKFRCWCFLANERVLKSKVERRR